MIRKFGLIMHVSRNWMSIINMPLYFGMNGCYILKAFFSFFLVSSQLDNLYRFFRTPPYKDLTITNAREVFLQLERPSDADCSEPIKFIYKPSDRLMGKLKLIIN